MSEQDSRRLRVIEGTGVPVPGQDIDTDRIIPARFLKAISFEGLETHVFEDDRAQATQQAIRIPSTPRRTRAARCCWSIATSGVDPRASMRRRR